MPRKDTSRIRTLLVRLDLDKSDEAAVYAHYTALTANGHGSEWIRDVLAKALAGDSSPHRVITPKPIETDKGAITQPKVIVPLPPGYGPRAKSSMFARPIPAVIGRKTE